MIKQPYLLFLGDAPDRLAAKVAQGICDWRPEAAIGQYRMAGCAADMRIPDMSIAEAREAGAETLVIGVANRGGVIADSWMAVLEEALAAGLDIASGLHNLLTDEPRLVRAARKFGRELHDVRTPVIDYPIANGRKRTGRRCLAVGTDVSVGKMYVSLAMQREMLRRGLKASFRATGQTGIFVAGEGVPLDAVVADFMAGAVEWLSPDNDDDHWDFIEGQGSLFHASYSGVTLALVHGGQPDAIILCHEPGRPHMRGLPDYQLPELERLCEVVLTMAHIVNPACRAVGVSVNTSRFSQEEARQCLQDAEARTGLPATDPIRFGAEALVDALLSESNGETLR
ncbi:MAG: DUF1611 domain-containing protein [Rhodobacteraceae bacterium]|nr:DUF1611 domain-containing protein [Paracoccaceae bacterium]